MFLIWAAIFGHSRLPANASPKSDIAELLTRPVGRPNHKPLVCYMGSLYQAASWKTARRIVAKLEFHFGELFPRVGFIMTNLRPPGRTWRASTQAGYGTDQRMLGTALAALEHGNTLKLADLKKPHVADVGELESKLLHAKSCRSSGSSRVSLEVIRDGSESQCNQLYKLYIWHARSGRSG